MPTGLENNLRSDSRALHLKHVLLEYEMLAPCLSHIGLDRTALNTSNDNIMLQSRTKAVVTRGYSVTVQCYTSHVWNI